MSEDTATPQTPTVAEPVGLGGWLILPAIGMFINLFIFGKTLLGLSALANPGVADKLAAAGIDIHDPTWVRLFTFEAIGYPMLFLLVVASLILFFMKSYWFPRLIIVFMVSNLIVTSGDVFLASGVTIPGSDPNDPAVHIVKAIGVCLVWIPYFLKSVRVKNTFVRHRPVPAAGEA
jgi:hypothetical protein